LAAGGWALDPHEEVELLAHPPLISTLLPPCNHNQSQDRSTRRVYLPLSTTLYSCDLGHRCEHFQAPTYMIFNFLNEYNLYYSMGVGFGGMLALNTQHP
jgi:hypothetical protein